MEAVGLIETKGVIAAVVAADAMLKAANVNLMEKTYVGGGLVTIAIMGDVGAVKASVEAGVGSINELNGELLVSQHIIPRPQSNLTDIVLPSTLLKDRNIEDKTLDTTDSNKALESFEPEEIEHVDDGKKPKDEVVKEDIPDEKKDLDKIDIEKLVNKKSVEKLISEYGLESFEYILNQLRVSELRKLARKYDDFGIKGREISNASKDILIMEFKQYYANR